MLERTMKTLLVMSLLTAAAPKATNPPVSFGRVPKGMSAERQAAYTALLSLALTSEEERAKAPKGKR
jgi:hypothetical protein